MINTNSEKIEEVLTRGVEDVIDKDHLRKELMSGRQLRVKFGIDPTSPDLHLGHSIPLRKLRQFQELGHKVILLIGDFTATIGDPSGRSVTRPVLSEKDIKKNMKGYVKQASKILDIRKVEIRYNASWYKRKGAPFLMELASRFTLARVSERDDFQKRIAENTDISVLELLYPLLQGYDSVELRADVEIGGRDQKFNLLMGRKVQKRYDVPEQDVLTLPLLEGIDGVKKMSKSLGNYIGLTELPIQMFGKIMSVPDSLIKKYLELATGLSQQDIDEIGKNPNPRNQKAILAKEIVKMYYGEKAAVAAENEFNKVHRDKELPTDIPTFATEKKDYFILDLLFDTKLASSKKEARRLVEGNGVSVNDSKIQNWREEVKLEDGMIIKVGSRKFIKIKIK